MPTHLRMRVKWQAKDTDPKNAFVINPCFRRQLDLSDPTSGTDAQQLCSDLASAMATWSGAGSTVYVSAYKADVTYPKPPGQSPNYPLARAQSPAGDIVTPLQGPPQLACCLSYYAGQNIPRYRGRLYIPMAVIFSTKSDHGQAAPTAAVRAKVAALASIFGNLGGSNVDWGVWSNVDGAFHKATHYWVDDSWDIIRSRKVKATTRELATTSG